MDKFKTIGVGGLPHTLNDFRQFLGRLDAPSEGIYQAFNNLLRIYGDNFIVQGCVVSGAPATTSITEGWIILGGELIKVDAQGPFNIASDNTFTKVTTFDSRGTKTFLNGSINETYEKNRGVISGSAGVLDFDGDTLIELTSGADTIPDVGRIEIKREVRELGDWDMDTDGTLTIDFGNFNIPTLKIRAIHVMIRNDSGVENNPLGAVVSNQLQGGVRSVRNLIGGLEIVLERFGGGIFDSASYNDISPALDTRGHIYIEYEA